MSSVLGRLAVACFIFSSFSFATNIADSRDSRNYNVMPSGKLNWFTNDLAFKAPEAQINGKSAYYPSKIWQSMCPEGTHVPTITEWEEIKKDRFMGPRKTPNVKNFAGKTRGYFEKEGSKKIKNKDVAYFAVAGYETQAMMFDLKRGNVKQVNLPPSALVPIRCVSERDLYAEKNVSRNDMVDGHARRQEIQGRRKGRKALDDIEPQVQPANSQAMLLGRHALLQEIRKVLHPRRSEEGMPSRMAPAR